MNKNRGVFLLELNVALVVVFFILVNYASVFLEMTRGLLLMQDDVQLALYERLLFARLEQEISYETELLRVQKSQGDYCLLETWRQNKQYYRRFYAKRRQDSKHYALYQHTQAVGVRPGINPLTPPTLALRSFEVQPAGTAAIALTLELEMIATGRRKKSIRYITLANGVVYVQK